MHQPVDLDLLEEFERLVDESEAVKSPQHGDHVIYAGKHKARVIRILDNGNVRIKFDNPTLIPPKMNVPPDSLVHSGQPRVIDPKRACPDCGEKWKEYQGFRLNVYYNCPKCGKNKEDAVNGIK